MGSPDWNVSMAGTHLRKFQWVYCPGHAGVKGNDRADRLAVKATISSCLRIGRLNIEELETLPSCIMPRTSHHRSPGLGEKGVERGNVRRYSFKRRERDIVNQTDIRTFVSKAKLGKLLRVGVKHIWAYSSA